MQVVNVKRFVIAPSITLPFGVVRTSVRIIDKVPATRQPEAPDPHHAVDVRDDGRGCRIALSVARPDQLIGGAAL